LLLIKTKDKQPNGRRKVSMSSLGVDARDQSETKSRAIPKVIFYADTSATASNHDRAFDDRRFHGAFPPQAPGNLRSLAAFL
jgi:hypothetical protein